MPFPPLNRDALGGFADRLNLTDRLQPYAAYRWSGAIPDCPMLHLEDVSAIPFLNEIVGVEEYQHRARVRAGSGDLYATVTPPDPEYEAYCQDTLDIGAPQWLDLASSKHPLAVAEGCLEEGPRGRLVETARAHGGVVIHPYMSIEDVWQLAERISLESGEAVTVVGPPPPVTWIANDKALFTELVSLVLGPGWTTETHETTDPPTLVQHLRDMTHRHDVVGIKRTRCASAMGNLVLDAASVRDRSADSVQSTVDAFLARTEWDGVEPVLAVAWENAISSPSTQWWLPPPHEGPPRLDGIYEQILEGDTKLFVGSRPSALPAAVHTAIRDASGRVAVALQALGYVGRCSFDHLVIGDPADPVAIRFTECNGRWGGTSTPMHLVDRVVAGARPPYRAQDFQHEKLTDTTFGEVRERLAGQLFDPRTRTGRYILYNVGPLASNGKFDVIALGETQAEAEQALLADFPRCLGL